MCMKITVCGSMQFEPKMAELIIGISVQQEYGVSEKNPMKFATDGRLIRRKVIENAPYNVFTHVNTTKVESRV